MIGATDVQNIFYKLCQTLSDRVYQYGNIPLGELKEDRITIEAKDMGADGRYWDAGFVEVNISVPDIDNSADLIRLNIYEKAAREFFRKGCGTYGDDLYRFRLASTGIKEDEGHNSHYVNARVKFEVINTQ